MQGKTIAGTTAFIAAWAGMAVIEANLIDINLPGLLDRVILVALGALTCAYLVTRNRRQASIDYTVLQLGREIERERQRQPRQRYDDGPTAGIGIDRLTG